MGRHDSDPAKSAERDVYELGIFDEFSGDSNKQNGCVKVQVRCIRIVCNMVCFSCACFITDMPISEVFPDLELVDLSRCFGDDLVFPAKTVC